GLHCELPSVLALRESGLLGRLQRLDLSGDRAIGDRAVALLADTPAPRLESLGLRATNLTAFGMKALFRAGRWPRLHTLAVDAAQLLRRSGNSAASLAELLAAPLLPRLRNLDLSGAELDAGLVRALGASPALGGLRELSLGSCRIGAAGMAALA